MLRRELLRLLSLPALAAATGAPPGRAGSSAQTAAGTAPLPDVEFTLTAAPGEVSLLPGKPTKVWRFTGSLIKGPADTLQTLPGSYLGPVIRLRRGQQVRVRFANQVGEDSIVHWHGLDVPESADGHPRLAIRHGQEYVYDFKVTNRAGTYWYHPHPHMRTGAQVYHGLAGLLLVSDDDENALELPSGDAELLCVLQDRSFDANNQLIYQLGGQMEMMNGVLGDHMLVSGHVQPRWEVDAGWQRVRLLNGSNARIYKLAWSRDLPMVVVGGDGGLLQRPLSQRALTLAPGQRADVLLDLTRLAPATEVHLNCLAYPAADAGVVGMRGMMRNTAAVPNGAALRLMTLRTRARAGGAFRLPDRLAAFDPSWSPRTDAPIRRVPLLFRRMQWMLAGNTFSMDEVGVGERVTAGSTHVWDFVNQPNGMGMEMAHPIHMHGPQFRVIDRTGGRRVNALREGIVDAGWTDTVLVLAGESVRVQVTFTSHAGLYLYHCHILEHEDMGMMRNFRVT